MSQPKNIAQYAPKHTASFAIDHRLHPWSFGQLTLCAADTYTDRTTFHPQLNLFDSSVAHSELSARARLSELSVGGGNLRITAWGRNLTNEAYRDFGILGFTTNQHAPLRHWRLHLVYEFNRKNG